MNNSPAGRNKNHFVLHARIVVGMGGGPEKTILNSPRFLSNDGYESACLYLHPPDDSGVAALQKRADELQAEFVSVPDNGLFDLSLIKKLLKICKDRKVSIWHAHDYKTNVLGVILSRFHRMKLVTTVHGWVLETPKLKFYYWIDKQSLRFYEKVICVSEDLYKSSINAGVSDSKCSLIRNAIDSSEFKRSQSSDAAKASLSFSQDRLLIGAIGRLSEEKGFHFLIAACENLIEAGHEIELAILGEGDQRQELEKQIAESKHPDRFHLLGYCADTISYFEAMDFFVLSSLREGLPNVLLEAMAMEVPIVSTKIAGVPNLISDGIHGVLVDSGSADALQQGIQRALKDGTLRAAMIQNAKERVENEFSFENRMSQVSQLYDQLLQGQ